jgi:hypothetical protein
MSVEITYDETGMHIVVTNGMAAEVTGAMSCPECGEPVGFIVAWFTENVIKPVRSYQLVGCFHEFDVSEYYLHATLRPDGLVDYEIRPVPEDRTYDPVATVAERYLWTTAGNSNSTRENFHLYGGQG